MNNQFKKGNKHKQLIDAHKTPRDLWNYINKNIEKKK